MNRKRPAPNGGPALPADNSDVRGGATPVGLNGVAPLSPRVARAPPPPRSQPWARDSIWEGGGRRRRGAALAILFANGKKSAQVASDAHDEVNFTLAGEVGDKMGITLKITAEAGFLRVEATGDFSLEDAKRNFVEVLEAVARYKVEKVLLDGRGLAGDPETMDRFFYGKFAAQTVAEFRARGLSCYPQFAYVLKIPVRDPQRFGETVAVNRGMFVKTFEDLSAALEWLGIAPANSDAGGGK